MNTEITFTLTQIAALCAAVMSIGGAYGVFMSVVKKLKEPLELLKAEMEGMKCRIESLEQDQVNTIDRIEVIEESSRVTHKALLALLKHGIDGNNISALEEASNDIQEYLIKR